MFTLNEFKRVMARRIAISSINEDILPIESITLICHQYSLADELHAIVLKPQNGKNFITVNHFAEMLNDAIENGYFANLLHSTDRCSESSGIKCATSQSLIPVVTDYHCTFQKDNRCHMGIDVTLLRIDQFEAMRSVIDMAEEDVIK